MDCHANGFLAGGRQFTNPDKLYSDFVDRAQGRRPLKFDEPFRDAFGRTIRHGDFFQTNQEYRQQAEFDSNIFRQAQRVTGSFFADKKGGPLPLIPKLIRKYSDPLTPADAARTLGISEAAAKSLVGEAMPRTSFDARFCNLRVGRTSALDEVQGRALLNRDRTSFGSSGVTHTR